MITILEYLNKSTNTTVNETKDYVVLTERNVDCKSLSKSQFVKYVTDDIESSAEKYRQASSDDLNHYNDRQKDEYKTKHMNIAKSKWKRADKINSYVDDKMNSYRPTNEYDAFKSVKVEGLWYFGEPVPTSARLKYDSLDRQLSELYESVKDNELFEKSIGWKIMYMPTNKSLGSSFVLKFCFDKKTQNEIEKRNDSSVKGHNRFYKDTNYWGD